MRENLQAIGTRPRIAKRERRWRGWVTRLRRPDPVRATERLEVIERLAAEERRATRAGEWVPERSWQRRWM
jgi:hypothetical protein